MAQVISLKGFTALPVSVTLFQGQTKTGSSFFLNEQQIPEGVSLLREPDWTFAKYDEDLADELSDGSSSDLASASLSESRDSPDHPLEHADIELLDRFSDELEAHLRKNPEVQALWIELPEETDAFLLAQCFNPRGPMPIEGARLSQVVTAFDAVEFWTKFTSNPQLSEEESDDLEAWVSRIEFCDTLLVRNLKTLSRIQQVQLIRTLRLLQTRAELLDPEESLPPILMSRLSLPVYSADETLKSSGWRSALDQDGPYVFRARRPFHPGRLQRVLGRWPAGILRACGQLWLASRNQTAISLSLSGPSVLHLSPDGPWIATLPPEDQRMALEEHPDLGRFWDKTYGDRITEIAFIPDSKIDLEPFLSRLRDCLLTDLEMRSDWSKIPDPFPKEAVSKVSSQAVQGEPRPTEVPRPSRLWLVKPEPDLPPEAPI